MTDEQPPRSRGRTQRQKQHGTKTRSVTKAGGGLGRGTCEILLGLNHVREDTHLSSPPRACGRKCLPLPPEPKK